MIRWSNHTIFNLRLLPPLAQDTLDFGEMFHSLAAGKMLCIHFGSSNS